MDQVLFCPFCGEAFEDHNRCPEHDLELVSWRALTQRMRTVSQTEPVAWHSPRLGRGWLAAGAGMTLWAFVALPLAHVDGALEMSGSMLRLALQRAPKLWLVPAGAMAELWMLQRRRTPLALRAARLAAAFVACIPVLAVGSTWLGARAAIAALAARMHQPLHLHVGAGALVVAVSAVMMLIGAFGLGVAIPSKADSKGRYD